MGSKKTTEPTVKPYGKKDVRRRWGIAPAGSKNPEIAKFLADESVRDLDKPYRAPGKKK